MYTNSDYHRAMLLAHQEAVEDKKLLETENKNLVTKVQALEARLRSRKRRVNKIPADRIKIVHRAVHRLD